LKLRRAFVAAVVALGVACSVEALDLAGKHCPCTDGFVCDTTTNVCVTPSSIVRPVDDGGVPDNFVPPSEAGGSITVLNLVPKWQTANGIRWEWQAIGDPARFARYEVVTGPRAEDVRARASSTRLFDPTTNPELATFAGRSADAGVPASLWTITDGHKEGETVFAQVLAYDTAGLANVSDVASAITSRPRAEIDIFAETKPDGGVFVPSTGTKIVTTNPFADAACLEHTVACQGPPPCPIETGIASIDGINADAIQVTEFPDAFLELAVRGTNLPGKFIDVILFVGQDSCGTACRMRFSGLSFGVKPDAWRLLQIPLGRFKGNDGTGGGLTNAQLNNRKRIAAFLVDADQPDAVKVGLDQARIRW